MWQSMRASGAPRQWWSPAPNARWSLFLRSRRSPKRAPRRLLVAVGEDRRDERLAAQHPAAGDLDLVDRGPAEVDHRVGRKAAARWRVGSRRQGRAASGTGRDARPAREPAAIAAVVVSMPAVTKSWQNESTSRDAIGSPCTCAVASRLIEVAARPGRAAPRSSARTTGRVAPAPGRGLSVLQPALVLGSGGRDHALRRIGSGGCGRRRRRRASLAISARSLRSDLGREVTPSSARPACRAARASSRRSSPSSPPSRAAPSP